jgi:hypothetical protein
VKYLPGMKEELFQIKLDETGKRLLMRINFWARLLYIFSLITCIFDFILAWIVFTSFSKYSSGINSSFLTLILRLDIFFLVLYAVLLPAQAYYFLVFTGKSRKAMQYEDSTGFNYSFKWLLRHAVIAAILFSLNSIWGLFNVIREIYFLNY